MIAACGLFDQGIVMKVLLRSLNVLEIARKNISTIINVAMMTDRSLL